jgi:hypothetical protein
LRGVRGRRWLISSDCSTLLAVHGCLSQLHCCRLLGVSSLRISCSICLLGKASISRLPSALLLASQSCVATCSKLICLTCVRSLLPVSRSWAGHWSRCDSRRSSRLVVLVIRILWGLCGIVAHWRRRISIRGRLALLRHSVCKVGSMSQSLQQLSKESQSWKGDLETLGRTRQTNRRGNVTMVRMSRVGLL